MDQLEPCEKHDLAGCAICRPRPEAAPASAPGRPRLRRAVPAGAGPWFDAGYGGECSRGGHDFSEGTEIRADGDGGWECRECTDDY